jgi:hypothetical protein
LSIISFSLYMLFFLCSIVQMTNESSPSNPLALTPSRQGGGWSVERQRAFLEMLAQCGLVERAAGLVGMTRQSAYAFRQTTAGRAFDLAWDAALLLARQRLIDDSFEMAFQGSVERIYRDGKLVQEKRKRDPKMLLATIERLGSKAALGSAPVKAVAQEFSAFLDAMDADANGHGNRHGGTSDFMECRASWGGDTLQKRDLNGSSALLRRAAQEASAATPRLEGRRSS